MIEQLIELDKKAFFFFNGLHTPWLDQPMYFLSNTMAWLPLYVVMLYLIYKNFGTRSWIILLALAVTITLSDQITSTLMKPFFQRLRPTWEPDHEGLIHIVNGYKGRKYGFASSHAADTFGTATLLTLLLTYRYRWMFLLFIWAAFVSYTRIYLGVHYPGDIIAGALVGALCATGVFFLSRYVLRRIDQSRLPEAQ
jgi:undecaprenyl-diphosphatase